VFVVTDIVREEDAHVKASVSLAVRMFEMENSWILMMLA
jgi:hypothetical protein